MVQPTADRGFLVECFAPGVDPGAAQAEADRILAAVDTLCAAGRVMEYLGAVLVPSDEVVLHRFRAMSSSDVHDASVLAGLDFERVLPTLTLLPRRAGSAANVGDHPISPATAAP